MGSACRASRVRCVSGAADDMDCRQAHGMNACSLPRVISEMSARSGVWSTSLHMQSQQLRKLLGDCLRRSAYTSPLRLPFFAYLSSSLHAAILRTHSSSELQA